MCSSDLKRTCQAFARFDAAQPAPMPGCSRNQPAPMVTMPRIQAGRKVGSRVQPDGSDRRATQPAYRRALGKVYRAIAAAWVTGPVPDTQCGFKGFRREAGRDLFARRRIESIVFDAEILHLARRRGYRVAIVPVEWADRRGSRMHVRPGLALRVLLDLARIPLLHRGVGRAGERPGA